ncbi:MULTISPECIES: response regulator transcription factor [Streptomyces]|uniref:Response regulator transcription factor n=1 Tax=Streptomyces hirsutus TaxID=35620 RepID=A0ABZ1GJC1_9ACTN|nr:response regulator transcription factor [Streptomyces hirsutus]WSD06240.1 response regulator transcription factor [Streptomyces hirsutus]WTD20335.1 response regulator transcription factor [Streptomyces hirsutus]WTD74742.1 response regulator transcription factor [Streptomyces sp. NBC_01635]
MVRILLAEDVHMVRGALVALLELEHDLQVVASVDRGDLIVPSALETRPDVAVIDIDLPGTDGLTAAADLHQKVPECRTLMLTSLGRPGTLRRAMAARVSGFLLKDSPPSRLAQAVRSVAAGRRVIDPELALTAWEAPDNPLSPRETQVLRLAARGADAAEIADQLYLTQGTVRNYLTAIVDKLKARNRIDAIRIAEEAGWIP